MRDNYIKITDIDITNGASVSIPSNTSSVQIIDTSGNGAIGATDSYIIKIPDANKDIAYKTSNSANGTVEARSSVSTAGVFFTNSKEISGDLVINTNIAILTLSTGTASIGDFILIEGSPISQKYFSVQSVSGSALTLGTVTESTLASLTLDCKIFSHAFPMDTALEGLVTVSSGNVTLKSSLPYSYLSKVLLRSGGLKIVCDKGNELINTAISGNIFKKSEKVFFDVKAVIVDPATPANSLIQIKATPNLKEGSLFYHFDAQTGFSSQDQTFINGISTNNLYISSTALTNNIVDVTCMVSYSYNP